MKITLLVILLAFALFNAVLTKHSLRFRHKHRAHHKRINVDQQLDMWGEPIPTNNIPLFVHDDVDSSELPADKQRTPTELTEQEMLEQRRAIERGESAAMDFFEKSKKK